MSAFARGCKRAHAGFADVENGYLARPRRAAPGELIGERILARGIHLHLGKEEIGGLEQAIAVAILMLGVIEDGLDIDAGELDADGGLAFGAGADADFADATGDPTAAQGERIATLGAGKEGAQAAVVEGGEPGTSEPAEGFEIWREPPENQGAGDALMGAQQPGLWLVWREFIQIIVGSAGLRFDQGAQFALPELAGVIELLLKAAAEGVVAIAHLDEKLAHGDQVAEAHAVARLHQNLSHDVQHRAFALERGGDGDEDFDQRGGEGVEIAELTAVALAGDDGIDDRIAELANACELGLDELASGFVLRFEEATARDGDRKSTRL